MAQGTNSQSDWLPARIVDGAYILEGWGATTFVAQNDATGRPLVVGTWRLILSHPVDPFWRTRHSFLSVYGSCGAFLLSPRPRKTGDLRAPI